MVAELRVQFQSMEELKTYLEQTLTATQCTCRTAQESAATSKPVQTNPPEVFDPEPVTNETEAVAKYPTPAPSADAPAVITTSQESTVGAASAPAVSSTAPTYTLDDLSRAGTELVDAGRMAEIPELLKKFGVHTLPDLDPVHYNDMAMALRELGAHI